MSSSQGIIIALDGKSVRNDSPNNTAVDTNYNTLKMRIDEEDPNFGRIRIRFSFNPYSVSYSKLLFTHTFKTPYTPLYYFAYMIKNSDRVLLAEYGKVFALDVFGDRYFEVVQDGKTVNFYFRCSAFIDPGNEAFDPNLTGNEFEFQYSFFVNRSQVS